MIRSGLITTSENAPSTLSQRVGDRLGQSVFPRKRNQVDDHFGIAVRLKNRSLALQPARTSPAFDQIAVMRHRNRAFIRLHQNRLRVQQRRVAGGRIARVPDGQRAAYLRQHVFGEDIGNHAHRLVDAGSQAIGGNNPRRFLPAMLQSVQAQVSQLLRLGMSEDRHHTALVVKFVESFSISPLSQFRYTPRSPRTFFAISAIQALQSAATNSGSVRKLDSSADS